MKKIKLIIAWVFSPILAMADTLNSDEIEQLIDSAFHADTGIENGPIQERSHYRWKGQQNVFIAFDKENLVTPRQEWLDLIKVVCNEISQLTGVKFNFYFEVKDWDTVREKMENGGGSSLIYFYPASVMGGTKGRVTIGSQAARIYINIGYSDKTVTHVIREELSNAIGLYGDTWRDQNSVFWQGGDENINAQEFSETDRRIIYAYYALERNTSTVYFDLEGFRKKIAQVEIDEEKVYGGLFRNKTLFRPNWLYFERYPWVYSPRGAGWYYFYPHKGVLYIWNQNSQTWASMAETFRLY